MTRKKLKSFKHFDANLNKHDLFEHWAMVITLCLFQFPSNHRKPMYITSHEKSILFKKIFYQKNISSFPSIIL